MTMAAEPMTEVLARLKWRDPQRDEICDFVLREGATATIGRSSNNDIQIAEQHVSRQHAVISYRDGVFFVTDLSSSNGTFVNGERVTEPFPLFAGDQIRLYVPELEFLAANEADLQAAEETGRVIVPAIHNEHASLIITNGPQEGQTVPLVGHDLYIGRATSDATWEIRIRDRSVSRPHAHMVRRDGRWYIIDLGSSNGTAVNHMPVRANQDRMLNDGDTITLGGSTLLFRADWNQPDGNVSTPTEFRTKDS
jgi:pSer/pThr/pTyr-binding forkhead associated (FHA) protein